MPNLFEITAWFPQPWYSTGGTRAKKYLQSPDGKFYYFKRSQYKDPTVERPGKDFKYEFWSEVIAFELGTLLGFDVLRYDIAIDGEIMGCISESMINAEKEELIEGVKYLQAYSRKYDPALKEYRNWYTFQFIENALKSAKIRKNIINQIVEIIIFDALIGNGDRHQENWAIISKPILITDYYKKRKQDEGKFSGFDKAVQRSIRNSIQHFKRKGKRLPKEFYVSEISLAPIYDSGSSLGRELVEGDVEKYCSSDQELAKYIEKGRSEVHWKKQKISHFKLVENLKSSRYKQVVKDIWKRINKRWDDKAIENIVGKIDILVPETHAGYKIPERRKELIVKIIKFRKKRLEALFNEGV